MAISLLFIVYLCQLKYVVVNNSNNVKCSGKKWVQRNFNHKKMNRTKWK